MTATAFITGASKSGAVRKLTTGLGRVFLGTVAASRFATGVKNPDALIPGGLISVKSIFGFLGGSGKKNPHFGNKLAQYMGTTVQSASELMNTPLSGFTTEGEGGITNRLASVGVPETLLGANPAANVARVMKGPAKATGSLLERVGGFFGFVDEKLDMQRRVDGKIKQQEERISALGELVSEAGGASRFTSFKTNLEAGIKAEGAFKRTPMLKKRNALQAADAIHEKHAAKALQSAAHIKDKALNKEKREAYVPNYTAAELKQLNAVQPSLTVDMAHEEYLAAANKVDGKVPKKLKKAARNYKQAHEDLAELESKKAFWQNPAEALKKRGQDITIGEAADFTLRWGMVAQDGIGQVKNARLNLRALKQLMADVKGVKPQSISTWSALFGATTPMLKEARGQYVKATLLALIPFFGGAIGQEVATRKLHREFGKDNPIVTMGATLGFQAIQSLGGFFTTGETMLQDFANMRITQESGAELTPENYAQLLAAASSEIKSMGGTANYNTTLIAQYYAENKTPIAQVMQDINAGKATLTQRSQQGAEMIKQSQMATQAVQQTQAGHAAPAAPDMSAGEAAPSTAKFADNPRNQSKGGQGSFTERARASQEAGGVLGFGGGAS
ncbi:MAG: hypothetical protein P8P30_04270 [Rickettsiales bacterium]|nr:hypothetical protein [Rickettsiales bacterium]